MFLCNDINWQMQLNKRKNSLSFLLRPINKACNAHPQRSAHLALPRLGCRLKPCSNWPCLYPGCLRTCRPAQPARALFLSLLAFLPTFVTYLHLCHCPLWRRREGTKLRLSKCQRSNNRKVNLRKWVTWQPPVLDAKSCVSLVAIPPVWTLQLWNRRAEPSCERLRQTNT